MAETHAAYRRSRARRSDSSAPLPEHVTAPLLSLITQRSLDADYEHVAARRRETGPSARAHPTRRRTAGLVLLAFGILVTVAAVQTSRNASADDASRESLIEQADLRRHTLTDLQQQLDREEARVLALQGDLSSLSDDQRSTQARIDRLGTRTGFAPVRGQGVQVTVTSAPGSAGSQLVRDSDLTLLTDALWAAGAEAISVNGQRLTALSAFRNVGVGILVNSQPISPPYVFDVVGDPDTLPANLLSSAIGEKWYALKDSLGFSFSVHDGGTMSLPAAAPQRLRSAETAAPQDGHTRTQMGDSAS
jgi:uncharacterized protein YlxW (UPF0749 family)